MLKSGGALESRIIVRLSRACDLFELVSRYLPLLSGNIPFCREEAGIVSLFFTF